MRSRSLPMAVLRRSWDARFVNEKGFGSSLRSLSSRCGLPVVARSLRTCQVTRVNHQYQWLERYYEDKEKRALLKEWWESKQPLPPPLTDDANARPRAWFEFSVGEETVGRVTVELARDLLPNTCENFLRLCQGVNTKVFGKKEKFLHYKGTNVHQVYKDTYLLMGDLFNCDGRGGHSTLGKRFFDDEGFFLSHDKPGMLSMAQAGKDQNSSIFFFTLKPLPHLNGRNVCFGAVVEGMDVLEKLGRSFQVKGRAINAISISDCGVI